MIKPIMLEEIMEGVVNFRDNVTVTLSQNIPQPIINEFRIVKQGTQGVMTNRVVNVNINDHHSVIEGYKNLTTALFKRNSNFVRYLKKDNNYFLEPIK